MKFFKTFIVLVSIVAFQAKANLITINIDDASANVGDLLTVNVLADFTDEIDTLELDVLFDTSLFSVVETSLSTDLKNDDFDYFTDIASNPVGLGLSYFSFAEGLLGNVLLASFQLEALALGQTDFNVDTLVLSNALIGEDYQLTGINTVSASIVDNTVAVPEPTSLTLLALAICFACWKRRGKEAGY